MSKDNVMNSIKSLIDGQRFAVLGSSMSGQPYLNIVAFIPYDNYHSIIFVTSRMTRKYANLKKHPKSSILIDSRTNNVSDSLEASGVTGCGDAYELSKSSETDEIMNLYIKRHPALEDFVKSPTTAIFKFKVDTYYFVENFQEVTEIHLNK